MSGEIGFIELSVSYYVIISCCNWFPDNCTYRGNLIGCTKTSLLTFFSSSKCMYVLSSS